MLKSRLTGLSILQSGDAPYASALDAGVRELLNGRHARVTFGPEMGGRERKPWLHACRAHCGVLTDLDTKQ